MAKTPKKTAKKVTKKVTKIVKKVVKQAPKKITKPAVKKVVKKITKKAARVPVKVVKKAPAKASAKKKTKKPVITTKLIHVLIPEHTKLSEKEKDVLMKKYHIQIKDLPKILITDSAIRHLGVKEKDVIKIIRKSPTSGTAIFYRGVING